MSGGRRLRHERGAGQHACHVKFKDGPVNSGGLAEVVSVDDETRHRVDEDTECAFPTSMSPKLNLAVSGSVHSPLIKAIDSRNRRRWSFVRVVWVESSTEAR